MSNLLKDNKELMKEYNYEKNNNIDLNTITFGSNKKIWWKCKKGHEWPAIPANRKNGTNCPYCSNRKVLAGYNDLATTNPEVLNKWNYHKNVVKPNQTIAGTAKKVWWKCEKGHEWEEEIRRIVQGLGCPVCSGHRVLPGYNDLATTNPELLSEWNYEKNKKISPESISFGSNELVWWKCSYGHEWQARVFKRVEGNNCPQCFSGNQTSFAEQSFLYYISKKYTDTKSRYRDIFENNMEIDIYIPDKNIGIEYDGKQYHKGTTANKRELTKYEICKENNIYLIRVKEDVDEKNEYLDVCDSYIRTKWDGYNYNELDKTISSILKILDINIKVDTYKDRLKIINKYKKVFSINNGISDRNLLKEWNYEKNGSLKPENFTKKSAVKVWWKCEKGHEWEASPNHRSRGIGCPICSNHKVLRGFNDLATTNPELLKEWNYEKNIIEPNQIVSGSQKKVWWKCEKGHVWEASPEKRIKGTGCPICSNKKILKGYNDLATTNPELLKEWDYEKNTDICPYDVNNGSGKKVWWKCTKCGKEWRATIVNRTKRNHGCPKCGIEKIRKSKNKVTMQISLDGKILKTYSSAKEAEQQTGIKHISDVCNGKREIAGGYKWKYQEEINESRNY